MSYDTLIYDVSDRILTLTLNRPDALNSFTLQMANDLIAAFNRASDDDAVHAIVVTGAGRAFCAGMDLNEAGNVFGLNEAQKPTMADLNERLTDPDIQDGVRDVGGLVSLAIFNCNKPVIAAINGPAVGVGATMTCAMDIRIASEKARIGFVFNKIGITPEACSTWFLPRIVGMSRALEWAYTGEILSPEDAQSAGLVRSVEKPEALLDAAYAIAGKIADRCQTSIALTRQMMYRNSAESHPLAAHKVESLSMFYQSIGPAKEGIASFLEKRAPEFTQKTSTDMPAFYPWWMD